MWSDKSHEVLTTYTLILVHVADAGIISTSQMLRFWNGHSGTLYLHAAKDYCYN